MLESTRSAFQGILAEPCDDMNNNIFIAGKHSLTQEEYETMIRAFFPSVPDQDNMHQRSFTDQELQSSCTINVVRFLFAAGVPNNGDVGVFVAPHVEDPDPNDPVMGRYSIHLFRALKHLYNPEKFLFCKARTIYKGQIVVTLVVAAVTGATVHYYGDLTNMYP